MIVLTVNAGSTSVRLGLYDIARRPVPVSLATVRADASSAAGDTLRLFTDAVRGDIRAVAHRVVHGGPRPPATCAFDAEVEEDVARAVPLAPLHNTTTLAWLRTGRRILPEAAPIAVFDSAFFSDLPARASNYALPRDLAVPAPRRLGFHGLAHRSMLGAFARARPHDRMSRIISFQLGGGCSVAALRDGRAVDTSMGFTPLEGLVMATRAGDIDPGLLLHLLRLPQHQAHRGALERLLEESSGLAALAGTSDVRALVGRHDADAELALDVYCYRARKYLGAYYAALGGCNAILFGGGVGEHVPGVRQRILEGLEDLGISLDTAANDKAHAPCRISAPRSRVAVWVVRTDEERVLAEEALAWLRAREDAAA